VRAAADSNRALGLIMCTALVVGNTIGVGIFMLPASLAPYGMNAVPAWLITSIGSIFIAWVYRARSPPMMGRMPTPRAHSVGQSRSC